MKTDSNKVVINNYSGKGYGDNGKYIAELLKEEYDVVWLVRDLNDITIPSGIRKIKYGSFKSIKDVIRLLKCNRSIYSLRNYDKISKSEETN